MEATEGLVMPVEVSSNNNNNQGMPRQSWFKYDSLPGLRQQYNGSSIDNPIQDFLRSAAYDESAPYLIQKDVMATYVKSCAGYCVITYLLVRWEGVLCCVQSAFVFTSLTLQFVSFFPGCG